MAATEIQVIKITLDYRRIAHCSEVHVFNTHREAKMEYSLETKSTDIEHFLEDFGKVVEGYKFCAKHTIACRVCLFVTTYDQGREIGFDDWYFNGVPSIDDEGLRLSFDALHANGLDIYIAFAEPILSQLEQANVFGKHFECVCREFLEEYQRFLQLQQTKGA